MIFTGDQYIPCGWAKTCAIVASGSRLIQQKLGGLIDTFDVVMRFNHAPVTGFEDHVGSKTSIRIVSENMFIRDPEPDIDEPDKTFPGLNTRFFTELSDMDIFVKGLPNPNLQEGKWSTLPNHTGCFKNIPYENMFFISRQFENINQSKLGKPPTCGYIGAQIAKQVFEDVHLFGFTFYKENWSDKHYWEEMQEYDQQRHHNFSAEESDIINDPELTLH